MDEQESTETDTTGNSQNTADQTPSSESQSSESTVSDTQSSEGQKRQEELDLIKDLLSSMTKSSSIVSN